METRITGNEWTKDLWKILTHPTFKVVAAFAVMAISTWIVVSTQVELKHDRAAAMPLLFGHK